jgi:uncharacterized coiled-coil DUF342 family protein
MQGGGREMSDETVSREYHDTVINKKTRCIAELRAERDALRDSLQSMVEYAEELMDKEDDKLGTCRWDGRDRLKADITKARGG